MGIISACILPLAALTALSLIEGLAAGALLTMIAQTMLPDAYFKGGPVIGLAVLTVFLAPLFFKSVQATGEPGEHHCEARSGYNALHTGMAACLQWSRTGPGSRRII